MDFHGVNQVYSESGVDLTLLRQNLVRSFEERWTGNKSILRFSKIILPNKAYVPCVEGNMPEFDAQKILMQLNQHQVEFVLIGGLAMMVHGSAYVTKDIDVCYCRTPQNIDALTAALSPLHPYLRGVPAGLPFKFDPPTIQAGTNFTLISDAGDLDLLGFVSGLGGFDKVLEFSEDKSIFGLTIHVLSLDGLVLAKKAAGRNKDKLHLLELEELKKMRDAQSENCIEN